MATCYLFLLSGRITHFTKGNNIMTINDLVKSKGREAVLRLYSKRLKDQTQTNSVDVRLLVNSDSNLKKTVSECCSWYFYYTAINTEVPARTSDVSGTGDEFSNLCWYRVEWREAIDQLANFLCEKMKIKNDEEFNKWAKQESIKTLVIILKVNNFITHEESFVDVFLNHLKDLRSLLVSELDRRSTCEAINKCYGNSTGSGSVSNSHKSSKHGKDMDCNSKDMDYDSLQPSQNQSSQYRRGNGWSTSNGSRSSKRNKLVGSSMSSAAVGGCKRKSNRSGCDVSRSSVSRRSNNSGILSVNNQMGAMNVNRRTGPPSVVEFSLKTNSHRDLIRSSSSAFSTASYDYNRSKMNYASRCLPPPASNSSMCSERSYSRNSTQLNSCKGRGTSSSVLSSPSTVNAGWDSYRTNKFVQSSWSSRYGSSARHDSSNFPTLFPDMPDIEARNVKAKKYALSAPKLVRQERKVYISSNVFENKLERVYERHKDVLQSKHNQNLIKKSCDVVSLLLTNVSNNSNAGIVDIDFSVWSATADEISAEAGSGIFHYKDKKFSGFYFHGNMEKEHCSLKVLLLISQMQSQFLTFTQHGVYKVTELKEYKHKTRFLLAFTTGNANDCLQKTIKDIKKEYNGLENKTTIEAIIRKFVSKYLLLGNRHTNLLHALNHLKLHALPFSVMLSKLQEFNNRVLKYYITSSCNKVEKNYDESDLLVLLLNTCDEEVLIKFMDKHKELDPDNYLVNTTSQTCTRIEEYGKK